MNDKEYNKKIQKIRKKNKELKQISKLKAERNKYKTKFETSKLIAVYLFFIFNVIMIFSMVAMWKFENLDALTVLISDIAAQIILYATYCAKAYMGKKQEEIIKLEREKSNIPIEDECEYVSHFDNEECSEEILG